MKCCVCGKNDWENISEEINADDFYCSTKCAENRSTSLTKK